MIKRCRTTAAAGFFRPAGGKAFPETVSIETALLERSAPGLTGVRKIGVQMPFLSEQAAAAIQVGVGIGGLVQAFFIFGAKVVAADHHLLG
jgi:hypothetical protein